MRSIKLSGIIIISFVCLCLCLNLALANDDTTVTTAEGMAAIRDGNQAGARDSAVNDALRKAVEQAVGTIISSRTVSENYSILSDRVYSKTDGYVKNYEVVSEQPGEQLYEVTVRAEVARAEIKDDLSALGLLMSQKNMPRVMLMVAEQNIGQQYYVYWWQGGGGHDIMADGTDLTVIENVLMRELGNKGFNLVDRSVMSGQLSVPRAYKVESLSNSAVKEIGNMYGAEVVIYGKGAAKMRGSVMGSSMQSSMANVSLRAVRTDNGQVIASDTASAAAVHPDKATAGTRALTQATEQIADNLLEQIMNRWSGEVAGGGLVQVTVTGNVTYDNLLRLKDSMRNSIRGVEQIYQRDFNETKASLEVEYTGPAQNLADGIAGTGIDGLTTTITGVSQNRVKVRINGF
ncbi:MAG: flagellar assembly protein T N-terminal domain-containing protein [Desulfosudaceae bacterium]